MPLEPHSRRQKPGTVWVQTILTFATLFTLFVARNTPPKFPKTPSLSHSISAVPNPGHRPHFDSAGSQWSAPVGKALVQPPASEPAHLGSSSELLSAIQRKGFHYNRPPPAV